MAGLTKNFAQKKPASAKAASVSAFSSALDKATIAVLLEYRGLSVQALSGIRRALRAEQATLVVLKNTLAKRAIEANGGSAEFASLFKGPMAVLLGTGDQVAPVKLVAKVFKELKRDVVYGGGLLDGQVLAVSDVEQLVNMPSLPELQGKLLGGIASPVNGLVAAISGPQRALVNVLDQLQKMKASAA
jgi:large subunit ribosomal protein L10